MSSIAAVVFDWAGTMIDFGCIAPVEALLTAFTNEGVTITEAEARRDMGRAKRDHVRALLAMPRIRDLWVERHGSETSEADVGRIHDALEPLMRAATARHAELIAGASDLAKMLTARRIKIGSSTGYTRTMMADILPRAAAQGYAPGVVVCSGETLEGRPSPLPMLKNMVELGAYPAWRCVKVDDAEVGIQEGRAAGAWTVGVAASGNGVGLSAAAWQALSRDEQYARASRAAAALKAAGAHYIVDTVADLEPVLAEIEGRIAGGGRPD
ncbi:MAG: phosphonoacetaldehyde hydrolase [Alphaproteobacteria bacterium]|nr:phosphonoacetaldehyde hydrolase [Alphaproteobacteria bacterium]MBL6937023.1 phosphonoacetaldehyde hydrolase [Alphaproteobacteria bacterium]MBL7097792.1 phosphonoacetaldehyde hydrolase [Alphaproteobacteria bacterium]